jgi:hypothetical protein
VPWAVNASKGTCPAGFFDSIGPLRKSLPKFAQGNRRESCLTYRSWQLSNGRDREPAQMAWTMLPFTVDGVKLAIASRANAAVRKRIRRLAPASRASFFIKAAPSSRFRYRSLLLATWFHASLLPMPLHATDPIDTSAGQAIMLPVAGIEETTLQGFHMDEFLDRLMAAESGGHLNKKNPHSTALGAFQFIKSTFLFVVHKHFPSEVAGLT